MNGYDFEIRVEMPGGGIARVVVCGEIDMAVRDLLSATVSGSLNTDGIRLVELELSGLRFIDACGVNALLAAWNDAQAQGKTFRVRGVNGMPLRLLEITGTLGTLAGKAKEVD